jgi:hypothetical protein
MERARAIRLRLGGSPSLFDQFPARPIGMRWTTYFSLEERYERYAQASMRLAVEHLDHLGGE